MSSSKVSRTKVRGKARAGRKPGMALYQATCGKDCTAVAAAAQQGDAESDSELCFEA